MPEVRAVSSLALLYAFRMLGLFMVLPVLMLYGDSYSGATPALLGLALGIYGLTQACFQIPLGLLSDVVGRKPVILAGLAIFALGSVVAAKATSIEGLVLGRALQGSGAIASAIMAMVADLTSEKNRTKAMAAIGASIGLSFSLAMILGPALAAATGLGGVFILSAVLASFGAVIVLFVVPSPKEKRAHRDIVISPALVKQTLRHPELLRLNWGIFSLHAILMASFVSIPPILVSVLGLARESHWSFYLPVLGVAFVAMLPLMILAEKKHKVKSVFVFSVALLLFSAALLGLLDHSVWIVIALVFTFFVAFNLLESMLPSLVSKIAPAGSKGTAMGLYSTCQFLGAFVGGVLGGWVYDAYSSSAVFAVSALLALAWFVVAFFMRTPKKLARLCFQLSERFDSTAVSKIPGVEDVHISRDESLVYLKVDRSILDGSALQKYTRMDTVL